MITLANLLVKEKQYNQNTDDHTSQAIKFDHVLLSNLTRSWKDLDQVHVFIPLEASTRLGSIIVKGWNITKVLPKYMF